MLRTATKAIDIDGWFTGGSFWQIVLIDQLWLTVAGRHKLLGAIGSQYSPQAGDSLLEAVSLQLGWSFSRDLKKFWSSTPKIVEVKLLRPWTTNRYFQHIATGQKLGLNWKRFKKWCGSAHLDDASGYGQVRRIHEKHPPSDDLVRPLGEMLSLQACRNETLHVYEGTFCILVKVKAQQETNPAIGNDNINIVHYIIQPGVHCMSYILSDTICTFHWRRRDSEDPEWIGQGADVVYLSLFWSEVIKNCFV